MQRDSNGGHKIPDIDPNWPRCQCCKDHGIVGGDTYEFRYCLCPVGQELKRVDAAAMCDRLGEANATRDKLMGKK